MTHTHRKDLEDTLVSKFPHISKVSHYYSVYIFRASAMSLVALARGASHGSAGSLAATWRARPQLRPLRDYDCSS